MKIVFLSSLLAPYSIGGGEVHTLVVAKALAEKGHSVTIYTGGEKERVVSESGVKIKLLPELVFPLHLKTVFMPHYTSRLRRKLEEEKEISMADVVNAFDADTILALSDWAALRARLIATIQDYNLICPNGTLMAKTGQCCFPDNIDNAEISCWRLRQINPMEKTYLRFAYRKRMEFRRKQCRNLKRGICVSKFVAKKIGGVHKHMELDVVGNAIPKNWFQSVPQVTKPRSIDVLYIGRLEFFKGVSTVIRAAALLPKREKWKIALVGGGNVSQFKDEADIANVKKRLNFVGPVQFKKVKKYYEQAKIVVVPSSWPEPCGRTIIEGMFSGAVVIGTKQGGTPELLDEGKTGFMIRVGDAERLAELITKLLNDSQLRRAVAQNAQEHALQSFTPEKIALQYEKAYRHLLK